MLLLNRLPQILMVMLMMSAHTDGHTVCTAVSTARETTVTCFFGTDMSQRGFSVVVFATPRSDSRMLLACNRQASGGLICDQRKDVDFDKNQKVINQLTLTRPPSNHTQGVQYLCEAVPSVEDHVQRCNLIYKDTKVPLPSEKERDSKQHFLTEYLGWGLIAIIMIIIIIILIIVVACVILWVRKERMRKWWTEPTKRLLTVAFENPGDVPADAVGETSCPGSVAVNQKRPLGGSSARIPSGVPSYFYNLGWKEATKENEQEHGKIPERAQVPPQQGMNSPTSSQHDGDVNLRHGAMPHKQPQLNPNQKQRGGQPPSSSSGSAPYDQSGDKIPLAIQNFYFDHPMVDPRTVQEKQTLQAVTNPAKNGQGKEMKRHGSYDIVPGPSEEKGTSAEDTDGDETKRLTEGGQLETDRGHSGQGEKKKGFSLFGRSQKDKSKKEKPQKTKQQSKGKNGKNRQVQEQEPETHF